MFDPIEQAKKILSENKDKRIRIESFESEPYTECPFYCNNGKKETCSMYPEEVLTWKERCENCPEDDSISFLEAVEKIEKAVEPFIEPCGDIQGCFVEEMLVVALNALLEGGK